jgi:hypothetical protein
MQPVNEQSFLHNRKPLLAAWEIGINCSKLIQISLEMILCKVRSLNSNSHIPLETLSQCEEDTISTAQHHINTVAIWEGFSSSWDSVGKSIRLEVFLREVIEFMGIENVIENVIEFLTHFHSNETGRVMHIIVGILVRVTFRIRALQTIFETAWMITKTWTSIQMKHIGEYCGYVGHAVQLKSKALQQVYQLYAHWPILVSEIEAMFVVVNEIKQEAKKVIPEIGLPRVHMSAAALDRAIAINAQITHTITTVQSILTSLNQPTSSQSE